MTFDIDEELISCQRTRAAASLSRILDAGNKGKLTAEGVRGPSRSPPTPLPPPTSAATLTPVTLEADEARRLDIRSRLRAVRLFFGGKEGGCQISGTDRSFPAWRG